MNNISIYISLFSLAISFFVAFRNVWISRKRIDIIQTNKSDRSAILRTYDGSYRSYSDDFKPNDEPNMPSMALAEVIITNKSSLPISILEFKIEGADAFSSYSYTHKSFTITTGKNSEIVYNEPMNYLQPEFTLQPYTSDRGFLSFWVTNNDKVPVNKNITLIIITSRGTIKKKIKFPNEYSSLTPNVKYSYDDLGVLQTKYY